MTIAPVAIKGQVPAGSYQTTLLEIYEKHRGAVYARQASEALLQSLRLPFAGLGVEVVEQLFPEAILNEQRGFARHPLTMKDASDDKFDLNLRYQDSRIKLEAEASRQPTGASALAVEQDVRAIFEALSILLNTALRDNRPLWEELTDNDLDALVFMILDLYDRKRSERLLQQGLATNQLALACLPPVASYPIEQLIAYCLYVGTEWWQDPALTAEELERELARRGPLAIDDVERFKRDVLASASAAQLLFFFDDNGELVWDLALIQRLLRENEQLQVVGVVTTRVISNNANIETLTACLKQHVFQELRQSYRFSIFPEDNLRSSIDPGLCSHELFHRLFQADYAFIKGVSFFETMQALPIEAYYGFTVHSADSQICTGLQKGAGIFVRVPRGAPGYQYHKKTLCDLYPSFV